MRSCAVIVFALGCAVAQALPKAPRVLWQIEKPRFSDELSVQRGKVWAGGAHLTVHDLHTGKELHRADLDGNWHHPVLSGGLVFARNHDGSLHALVPDLSRELWSMPLRNTRYPGIAYGDMFFVTSDRTVVAITGGEVQWRVDIGSEIAMKPATDGQRIYVGGTAGDLVGIDLQSGEEVWRRPTGAELGWTSPIVADGTLFLADRGIEGVRHAAFNAFDAATGEPRWSTVFGGTGFSRPHLHGDRVWAGFGVRVASFDRKTGELDLANSIKTGRNAFGLPGVVDGAIVFGNLDGNLYVHDLETGALKWRFHARIKGREQVGGWTLSDGVLLVGTTFVLYAIGETPGAEPAAPGFVLKPDR